MSLKDRLNIVQPQVATVKKEPEEPKYYESDLVAKQINLGVLDEILIDDEISALYVNSAKNIYIEKKGTLYKSQKTFRDNVQLMNVIKKNAKISGIDLDEKTPVISFNHKQGINVIATLPPLSKSVCVYIKCYKDKFANLQLMQEQGIISKETALLLEVISGLKNNVIIAGENNSLKTTFLSAMAKCAPENNARNILIDYNKEIEIEGDNFSNYDFSSIDEKTELELIDRICSSNPDRLIVNTNKEEVLAHLIKKIQQGYKGLIITISTQSKIEALNKLTYVLLKSYPYIGYEKAKEMVYSSFDLILYTKSDKDGKRLDSLSQIVNNKIEDIFYINQYAEFVSKGIVPEFYERIRLNSPINSNVFDITYKHTFTKMNYEPKDILKSPNPEIIKKFKKAEGLDETFSSDIKTAQDDFESLSSGPEDALKKSAKQKLEELKRNAGIQNDLEINLDDDIEL